jgi:hypothetical protein
MTRLNSIVATALSLLTIPCAAQASTAGSKSSGSGSVQLEGKVLSRPRAFSATQRSVEIARHPRRALERTSKRTVQIAKGTWRVARNRWSVPIEVGMITGAAFGTPMMALDVMRPGYDTKPGVDFSYAVTATTFSSIGVGLVAGGAAVGARKLVLWRREKRPEALQNNVKQLNAKLNAYTARLEGAELTPEAEAWVTAAMDKRSAALSKASAASKTWSARKIDRVQGEAYELLEAAALDFRRALAEANLPIPQIGETR